tara:strand:- start:166 stop:384 length:219 start_codon:yes stop_codon:yes gene_type:complete
MIELISNAARKTTKKRKSNKKNTMLNSMKNGFVTGFNKFDNSTAGKATGSVFLTTLGVAAGTALSNKITGRK